MTGLVRGALVALILVLLPGCDPPYLSDTYTTSTPGPKSFDASELAGMPVVVLAFMAPSNLQGFSPTLSHALSGALTDVAPPIREIPTNETLNRLTDQGLATEYADLRAGFARNGMLDRQRLRRIGLGLGLRYVLLPGLAQFDETIIDKYEAVGLKLLRNRVTTLRLWLQLWDSADWSYRLGIVRRSHYGDSVFEREADRCPGADRKETVGSDDSRWFDRIQDGNPTHPGSLSEGSTEESSGSWASGPACGVRIAKRASRCFSGCVVKLPSPATSASTSAAAAMK